MQQLARFGVAGNPPHFWESKYSKERANSPEWLDSIGLDALEIQCTYGIRMPDERAKMFLENSKKYNIALSIHAPYYINIGVENQKTLDNSVSEIQKAIVLCKKLDTKKIIFHTGGIPKSREESCNKAIKTLKRVEADLISNDVYLYPEIGGKCGQLGSLEDIIFFCKNVKNVYPCLDLAHLHARTNGTLYTKQDFLNVFKKVENELGNDALHKIHIHMYPVDFGTGGEKAHKAFDDLKDNTQLILGSDHTEERYTPRYEPFIEAITEMKLYPTIICEAKDSQDVGALAMKKYYKGLNHN
jgi:deoxyribonuclease-4